MSGRMKTDFNVRAEQQTLFRIDGLKKIQTAFRIFDRVQGLHLFLAGTDILPVLPLGFHLLDMSAVTKHDPAELKSGQCADDLPFESFLNHFRDQPGMIHMGMSQEDVFYVLGSIGSRRIISFFNRFSPLKHAAIDQEPRVGMFQKKTGSSYGSGCSQTSDLHD